MVETYKPNFSMTEPIKDLIEQAESLKSKIALCHNSAAVIDLPDDYGDYIETHKVLKQEKSITEEGLLKVNSIVRKAPSSFRLKEVGIGEKNKKPIYRAALIPKHHLDGLLFWVNESLEKLHPIILSAIFHYEFVKIHPFDNGNGRTARSLSTFLLCKAGYNPHSCYILKENFEKSSNKDYLQALDFRNENERTEFYDDLGKKDITPWIEYFCTSLITALKQHKQKLYTEERQRILTEIHENEKNRTEILKNPALSKGYNGEQKGYTWEQSNAVHQLYLENENLSDQLHNLKMM